MRKTKIMCIKYVSLFVFILVVFVITFLGTLQERKYTSNYVQISLSGCVGKDGVTKCSCVAHKNTLIITLPVATYSDLNTVRTTINDANGVLYISVEEYPRSKSLVCYRNAEISVSGIDTKQLQRIFVTWMYFNPDRNTMMFSFRRKFVVSNSGCECVE